MAKYYIKTGTLEIIFSTDKEPYDACRRVIHECNSNDEVDEYMYCDERGYRDYTCLLYTSPSPRDRVLSRMPSSA